MDRLLVDFQSVVLYQICWLDLIILYMFVQCAALLVFLGGREV